MKYWATLILAVVATPILQAQKENTYFPVSERGSKSTISKFEEKWYSPHLRLMKEPSLFAKKGEKDVEIYRFTLLPTWGDPRCVAVSREGDQMIIRYARLDGDGGYDPGKLVEQEKRQLTADEQKKFIALFNELAFSKQPTQDPFQGLDGSEWILERLKDGQYHVVVRWTADAYDPKKRGTESFVKLCQWMLAAAPRNKKAEQDAAMKPQP